MKTNYKVLLITFIINILMTLSLNSFSSHNLYLPMIFLYFLSGLASFMDKISFYKDAKLKTEEQISWLCFCVCLLVVCFYIAYSLKFIEINFQRSDGTYKILMQGIQNAFFTFNSINVTPVISIFAIILPFAYPALCLVSYLREQGLTKNKVKNISKNNKFKLTGLLFLSIIIGFIGKAICYLKFRKSNSNYGSPQYSKYFIVAFIVSLCFLCICFFLRHKNND